MIEVRIESGIEMAMMSVLRQLPINRRIISPVKSPGDHGLPNHSTDCLADEDGLICNRGDLQLRR